MTIEIVTKRKRLRKAFTVDPAVKDTCDSVLAVSSGCCGRVIFSHEMPGGRRKPKPPTGRKLYYKLNGVAPRAARPPHVAHP